MVLSLSLPENQDQHIDRGEQDSCRPNCGLRSDRRPKGPYQNDGCQIPKPVHGCKRAISHSMAGNQNNLGSVVRVGRDLGIDSLTQAEVADCFDAFCLCEEPRDALNLRELRIRLIGMTKRLTAKARDKKFWRRFTA
jgi:hypothetical protein